MNFKLWYRCMLLTQHCWIVNVDVIWFTWSLYLPNGYELCLAFVGALRSKNNTEQNKEILLDPKGKKEFLLFLCRCVMWHLQRVPSFLTESREELRQNDRQQCKTIGSSHRVCLSVLWASYWHMQSIVIELHIGYCLKFFHETSNCFHSLLDNCAGYYFCCLIGWLSLRV